MLGTLCSLITALTYVDAVKVLTQTPAVHTVSPGQEVVLKCNTDSGNYVSWYKQVPGEAPQYVLKFHHDHSSPSFGTGFSSDRFNSKVSSNVDYQFIIKRTETGDSAVYYCVSGVTVVTQQPPVVTLRTGETVTMDCNSAVDGPRWYKQVPGGVPQFVLNFYHSFSSPQYGSGFSSPKFTPTHLSEANYRFAITNVDETDSAVYYCATWDDTAKEHVSQ
ncbi:uncharacterized protein V6R79_018577 [Siganus canaliculatus]